MKWNVLFGSLALCACLNAPSYAGKAFMDRLLGLHGSGCDSSCCDTGCVAEPTCGAELCAPSCGLFGKHRGPTCGTEINACDPCGAPTCGAEISSCKPSLFNHRHKASCGPSCGVEVVAAPSCGCEPACDPCYQPRRRPLLELVGRIETQKRSMLRKLFTRNNACDYGCAADPCCGAELTPSCGLSGLGCGPSCGTEIVDPCCDSGCSVGRPGLLSKLFQRKSACCDGGCDSYATYAPATTCSSGCNSCGSGATTTIAPSTTPAPAVPAVDAAPAPPAPVVDPSAYLDTNRRVVQATSYVR